MLADQLAQAEGSRAKLITDAEGKTQLAELNAYSPEAIQRLMYQRARPRVGALACAPWFPGNVTQIVHGNRGNPAR